MDELPKGKPGNAKRYRDKTLKHLPDQPVSADDFAGRGHTRTAQAIVEIILGKNSNTRTIGLEGDWGSGKSSVIEIASEQLNKPSISTENFKIFTFDTWAHQGDPLRRSFLEKFLIWLNDNSIIKEDQKNTWLDQIQAKITRTTTHTEPVIKPMGILVLLLAPLLPIIYIWLSPLALGPKFQNIEILGIPTAVFQFMLFVLFLIPYAVVLFKWFSNHRGLGKEIMLLSRINDIDKTTQVIRDEDPTSIEFAEFIDKIFNEISGLKTNIIIVVDNIDRLPEEHILDAWAMMRGLLSRDAVHQSNQRRKIWLIVPYDRTHLESVYNKELGESDFSNTSGVVEKTFDITLRVSPPLVVHWRDYFYQQLDEAFDSSLNDFEKHILLRILEYNFIDSGKPANPRSIKSYINEIVSMALQWPSEIPVETMALYAVKKSELAKNEEGLKSGILFTEKYESITRRIEWQKYLTSLHYNVSPEDAYQVLIGRDIEVAFANSDSEELEKLSKNPGFDLVLGSVVDEKAYEWVSEQPAQFARNCRALNAIDDSSPSLKQVWATLRDATGSLGILPELSEDVVAGLLLLCDSEDLDGQAAARNIMARLCANVDNYNNFEGGEAWLSTIEEIVHFLPGKPVEGSVRMPGGPEFTCGALFALSSTTKLKLSNFTLTVDSDALTGALQNEVNPESPATWLVHVVNTLSEEPGLINSESLRAQMGKILSGDISKIELADLHTLLLVLFTLSVSFDKRDGSTPQIEALVNDGSLVWIYNQASENNLSRLGALAFWCIVRVRTAEDPPNPGTHPILGDLNGHHSAFIKDRNNAEDLPALVKEVANLCSEFGSVNFLVDAAIKSGSEHSMFARALSYSIRNDLFRRLDINRILADYDSIEDIIGQEDAGELLVLLAGWRKSIQDTVWDRISIRLLEALERSKASIGDEVLDVAKEKLKNIDQEGWESALVSEDKPLELLLGIIKTNGIDLAAGVFRPAMLTFAQSVLDENGEPILFSEDWKLLPQAMPPQTRKAFFRDLVLNFGNRSVSGAIVAKFLKLYPDFLRSVDIENCADVLVEKMMVPLLGELREDHLDALELQEEPFVNAARQCRDTTRELLRETVTGSFSTAAVELRPRLVTLARSLSIEIEDETDPESP